ncbi:hypothetical protein T11_1642 [Trichinella zimbabwensis]|uniref:Uncharacterized protein n=1 Tax=Trichinella zimbabwensis TaxID=268475 RepID=A0A0V1G8E8_9BILA|nr:hypothetical protein T11_1642 [Trichinella zimbabwensis]
MPCLHIQGTYFRYDLKIIRITRERKALNANAGPKENEFGSFEFDFKSLLQKEVNAKRSSKGN